MDLLHGSGVEDRIRGRVTSFQHFERIDRQEANLPAPAGRSAGGHREIGHNLYAWSYAQKKDSGTGINLKQATAERLGKGKNKNTDPNGSDR